MSGQVRNVIDVDENELPAAVREQILDHVRRGYRREHMMIGSDDRIYIHPELCMLYDNIDDGDENDE